MIRPSWLPMWSGGVPLRHQDLYRELMPLFCFVNVLSGPEGLYRTSFFVKDMLEGPQDINNYAGEHVF